MTELIILINILILTLEFNFPMYSLYIILTQLTLLLLFVAWKIITKKKNSKVNVNYYREIPKSLEPMVASCLAKEKGVYHRELIATIINLIQKEYLTVTINDHYGKKEITLKHNSVKDITELSISEQSILHFLLKNEEKIDLNEYIKLLTHNTDEVLRLKSLLSNLTNKISAKYYSSNMILFITAIFSLTEFYIFSMIQNNTLLMIPIFLLILILIWIISFHAESIVSIKKKYKSEKNKAIGFKKYLRDYEKLEKQKIMDSPLWNQYFPYIIAYNLTNELLDHEQLNKENHKLVDIYDLLKNSLD